MPRLKDITYSREATVAAVRDYYQFLTKLYMSPESIIEPPEGGWPNIMQEVLASDGKTDEVIELLRHLPYIRYDDVLTTPQAAPCTQFVDWVGSANYEQRTDVEHTSSRLGVEGPEWEHVPSHVVGLSLWSRNSYDFNLDTKLGVIYWLDCPCEIDADPFPAHIEDRVEEYAPENEWVWRGNAVAWAIPDLFEQLKDEFRRLNFFPISRTLVDQVYNVDGVDGSVKPTQKVFRDHGWPDLEKYDKEACMEALDKFLGEEDP
ncbi:hypothetical protein F4778DRAFT_747921 [Xylariomycetidae sp. FL2044]|nr:hypothetical protein F4778DRAFT_747921 [Xylariomycetidae sp. FL2044]